MNYNRLVNQILILPIHYGIKEIYRRKLIDKRPWTFGVKKYSMG
jgi:hypothetical protein